MEPRKRVRNRISPEPSAAPDAPLPVRAAATVAEFANHWLRTREGRTRKADAQRLRDHVLPLLGTRRLRELRAEDVADVVRRTLGKKGMNVKSARNAYGVFAEFLGDALKLGLLSEDPRTLPADIWPNEPDAPRPSFSASEVLALTSDERLDAELRIYNALAFYTGLAPSDVCALRFGDWSGQLGTPVVAQLTLAIERWQQHGFEAVYGRPPTPEDWLVPRRSDLTQPHSEGSVYKAFRRGCVALGIKTRSPNAIRSTFEKATHGSGGEPALD